MAPRSKRILRNARILTAPDFDPTAADILIERGEIAALLPPGTAADAESVDMSNRLALPGLVNAHTHSHANLLKGLADRWSLEMSLVNGPWVSGLRDPETMYWSTMLGAIDMLGRGCTACYDLVYEFPRPSVDGIAAVCRAYSDAGMRAVVCPMVATARSTMRSRAWRRPSKRAATGRFEPLRWPTPHRSWRRSIALCRNGLGTARG